VPPPEKHAGGEIELVELSADHPGFFDATYRQRRNEIARLALNYVDGAPVPRVEYTPQEHAVWRDVCEHLKPLHERYACREYLDACTRIQLTPDRIPQLEDVNAMLATSGGFRFLPVAGLVSGTMFLSYLAQKTFLSTQYMRHHSVPLYTPEPDVVHELIGHSATLAQPLFAKANEMFGHAAVRLNDSDVMTGVARLYWYSLEFGLVREDGALKAIGAGLLSSFGELERFEKHASIRPFNPEEMAATPYDPTTYQSILYVGESFESMVEQLDRFLQSL